MLEAINNLLNFVDNTLDNALILSIKAAGLVGAVVLFKLLYSFV